MTNNYSNSDSLTKLKTEISLLSVFLHLCILLYIITVLCNKTKDHAGNKRVFARRPRISKASLDAIFCVLCCVHFVPSEEVQLNA